MNPPNGQSITPSFNQTINQVFGVTHNLHKRKIQEVPDRA
jgi:hypothetical protein